MPLPRVFSSGLLVCTALLLLALPALGQRGNDQARPSPNAGVSQTIGTTVVDLHYSRPGVKGRTVFGGIAAWDQPWRAGANEPTTITFSDDVMVEGEALEAGTYNLFLTPSEDGNWTAHFTTPVRWGTMFDQATPVVEVPVSAMEAPAQEWLAYRFEDLSNTSATLVMHWENTAVPIVISTE